MRLTWSVSLETALALEVVSCESVVICWLLCDSWVLALTRVMVPSEACRKSEEMQAMKNRKPDSTVTATSAHA